MPLARAEIGSPSRCVSLGTSPRRNRLVQSAQWGREATIRGAIVGGARGPEAHYASQVRDVVGNGIATQSMHADGMLYRHEGRRDRASYSHAVSLGHEKCNGARVGGRQCMERVFWRAPGRDAERPNL